MTNLRKSSSGDFDVLMKRTDMQIAGEPEDGGLDLTLGWFAPVIITVTPQGIAEVQVYYKHLQQYLKFTMPLGIQREHVMDFVRALGVLGVTTFGLKISLARKVEYIFEMLMSLKTKPLKIKIFVDGSGDTYYTLKRHSKVKTTVEIGETASKTIRTLKDLKKALRKG